LQNRVRKNNIDILKIEINEVLDQIVEQLKPIDSYNRKRLELNYIYHNEVVNKGIFYV
jgi:hypothetical protein